MRERKIHIKIPPIGQRIVKSSISILLCYCIYLLRGENGIVFYSMLAALWCIRPYIGSTLEMAVQRTTGTLIGAVYGLILLWIRIHWLPEEILWCELFYDILVALFIIPIIHTTLILKHQNASYFSCVVFLSIVVAHMGDTNPYIFAMNRVFDTLTGVAVGIGINAFHIPSKKQRDVLFVSAIDDTLISKNEQMSVYTKRELNYLLNDGVNFTVATMRTPASLLKVLEGVELRLPIIAMDGAVLYDIKENTYVRTFVISTETSTQIIELIKSQQLNCFANVIVDDSLLIFYQDLKNNAERELYENMRVSPYRNYIHGEVPSKARVVYFMLLAETEKLEKFYRLLKENRYAESLKVLFYPSQDFQGYSYIKIYNKNANRQNMLDYLKTMTGLDKTVTFGSIEGKYDVTVKEGEADKVAKTLKRMYMRRSL